MKLAVAQSTSSAESWDGRDDDAEAAAVEGLTASARARRGLGPAARDGALASVARTASAAYGQARRLLALLGAYLTCGRAEAADDDVALRDAPADPDTAPLVDASPLHGDGDAPPPPPPPPPPRRDHSFGDDSPLPCPSPPVCKSNLQPDCNVRVFECSDTSSSAVLRELDESHRFGQKSAESTSI